VTRAIVTALLLCACEPTVSLREDRIRWDREPTIGVAESSLEDGTRWAIDQWEWGAYVGQCTDADICVSRGFAARESSGGFAQWPGEANPCDAVVIQPRFGFVIAHELGHCFGLGHNDNRRSIMHRSLPAIDEPRVVTFDDAEALDRVREEAR
jgi:hypothetical protein